MCPTPGSGATGGCWPPPFLELALDDRLLLPRRTLIIYPPIRRSRHSAVCLAFIFTREGHRESWQSWYDDWLQWAKKKNTQHKRVRNLLSFELGVHITIRCVRSQEQQRWDRRCINRLERQTYTRVVVYNGKKTGCGTPTLSPIHTAQQTQASPRENISPVRFDLWWAPSCSSSSTKEPRGEEEKKGLGVNYRHSLRKRRGPKCGRRSSSWLSSLFLVPFLSLFPFIYFSILSCCCCELLGSVEEREQQQKQEKRGAKREKGWQPSNRPTAATSHLFSLRRREGEPEVDGPLFLSHVTFETRRKRST